MAKADLRIDWATHAAAKYACENWHYTQCMPASKLLKVGVWETGRFVGVVIYGVGSGNSTRGDKYGLDTAGEVVELVRVALRDHVTPVSRIIAISMGFLRRQCSGIRLVVSFADPAQGHHGGIYQAGGWVYTGRTQDRHLFSVNGKILHPRTVGGRGWVQSESWLRQFVDAQATRINTQPKHRYLMPLDAEMRAKIAPLAKPYPKRVKQAMADFQSEQRQGGTDPHAPKLAIS
jgi:hypothetical protein